MRGAETGGRAAETNQQNKTKEVKRETWHREIRWAKYNRKQEETRDKTVQGDQIKVKQKDKHTDKTEGTWWEHKKGTN